MPSVNVSSDELRKQISELQKASNEIDKAKRAITAQYQQLGTQWNDAKYKALGDIVNESCSSLRTIEMIFARNLKSLVQILGAVMQYEAINISSGGASGRSECAPESGVTGPGAAESAEKAAIAESLTSNGLVNMVDFGLLDVRTARDMLDAIAETKEQFPDLDLGFVGSLQARNNGIAEQLTRLYLGKYRQHYPSASDDELMPYVSPMVAQVMEGLAPEESALAQALFVESPESSIENLLSAFNGISINESYGSDYDYFVQVRQEDVRLGWKPEGCDTPRATVDHELGHQIAYRLNAQDDPYIQELYAQFTQLNIEERSATLSGYAGESIHEFIAEAWSEHCNNPNCRYCASEVSARLIELYDPNVPYLRLARR